MENKDALYAKWLVGEISDDELKSAEGADALAEVVRIVNTVDQWSIKKYDTSSGYEKFKIKHQTSTGKLRRINWLQLSSIAASFLLFVFCWNTFFSNQTQLITAFNGQNEHIAFSDGSASWLNDGSSLEYESKKWTSNRSVKLTGEALFEVTKGTPFVVNTKHGSIQVLGTKFNVRAWGNNLYVECYEGKVKVTANGQEQILVLNESINVVQGSMKEKQSISNKAPLWQNSISRFHNEKLKTVVEEIERQYNVEVILKKSDRNFSGSFRHDNLNNALRDICKPLGLEYNISEDQKVINIE